MHFHYCNSSVLRIFQYERRQLAGFTCPGCQATAVRYARRGEWLLRSTCDKLASFTRRFTWTHASQPSEHLFGALPVSRDRPPTCRVIVDVAPERLSISRAVLH